MTSLVNSTSYSMVFVYWKGSGLSFVNYCTLLLIENEKILYTVLMLLRFNLYILHAPLESAFIKMYTVIGHPIPMLISYIEHMYTKSAPCRKAAAC